MESVDAVVIGAGVVGLAVARELALNGREVLILEAAERHGSGASSRNSEVIHAGIYYPRGSLKARLCVQGRELLYRYCDAHGIGHRRCGKLIVATSAGELGELAALEALAQANGVALMRLGAAETRALEPELAVEGALLSSASGILDAHALMLTLLGEAQAQGATLALRSEVTRVDLEDGALVIAVNGAPPALRARTLVNCAGVAAAEVARRMARFPGEHIPTTHLSKGNYFMLKGRAPFGRLIYPLPVPGGLGIHLTLDLAGRARFGPDVQAVERADFSVDAGRAAAFYDAIRRYWPGLEPGALEAGYAGLRARISAPGEPLADFRIDDAGRHGVPGLVHLFGIESPGLTASLAIAREVVARLD